MAANNRPRSRCALRGHDQPAKCSDTRYRVWGIGAAVNGLRARGRAAFGVDPTLAVLEVAEDLFNPAWFRSMAATAISPGTLASNGLPEAYDATPMSVNVPSFLTEKNWMRPSAGLQTCWSRAVSSSWRPPRLFKGALPAMTGRRLGPAWPGRCRGGLCLTALLSCFATRHTAAVPRPSMTY
jgi:hypothetical protein